jgi:hypothetical protein
MWNMNYSYSKNLDSKSLKSNRSYVAPNQINHQFKDLVKIYIVHNMVSLFLGSCTFTNENSKFVKL